MARKHVGSESQVLEAAGGKVSMAALKQDVVTFGRQAIGDRRRLAKWALVVAVVILALIRWDGGAAFFLGLLACSLTGLIDSRLSIAAGLACLALCPLLVIADQQGWLARSTLVNYYAANVGLYTLHGAADQVAIWAYYFLCIGMAARIVHYMLREKRRESV